MKKHFHKISLVVGCILICATLTITAVAATNHTLTYNPSNTSVTNVKTEKSINKYIDSINAMNAEFTGIEQDDIMTTITFSESMNATELEAYVKAYDIEVLQLQARGYDENGNRITFFSRTDKGFSETFDILNELADSDGVQFAGAIGIYALAKPKSISAIQKDNCTLLVDTSAGAYSKNNSSSVMRYEKNATSLDDENRAFVHSIAWDAEDVGLVCYDVK